MLTHNYYKILGLNNDCTSQDIKKSYHQLALIWHPDKITDKNDAESNFTFINEAYTVLNDPTKRAAYDKQRQQELDLNKKLKEYSNCSDITVFQKQKVSNFDQKNFDILKNILDEDDSVATSRYQMSNLPLDVQSALKKFINQEVISSDDEYVLTEYQPTFNDANFADQLRMLNQFYNDDDTSNSTQYFATVIEEIPEPTEGSIPRRTRRKSSIIIIGKTNTATNTSIDLKKSGSKALSKDKQAFLKLKTGSKRPFVYNEESDLYEEQPCKKVKEPRFRPRSSFYSELSDSEEAGKLTLKSILKDLSAN